MVQILQIRVSLPEFSNGVRFTDPIILENADNISLIKTVNSSDESVSFEIPLTDPKLPYVNYLRWWECWDTVTNTRKNYGSIQQITRSSGSNKRITGPGRSAVLLDYYKSVQTFYYPLDRFFDDLRYENLSSEPRTSTIINVDTDSEYYGLSKRSKDRAIDEQTGFIAIGRDSPIKGTKKTDSMWAGVGRADYLIVDVGDSYSISKVRVLLPWWGGATINNNRLYDWNFQTSTDNSSYSTQYTEIPGLFGGSMNPEQGGRTLYWGETGFEVSQNTIDADNPIVARYFMIDITNTYAIYRLADTTNILGKYEAWDWECGGSNVLNGGTVPSPSVATGDLIDKDTIVPSSDCFASVVEVSIMKKIIGLDTITQLAYHQIDSTNRQITFYHVPDASETFVAGVSRKFEPGGFFRNFTFTSFNPVVVVDEYNQDLYSGEAASVLCPAYTNFILMQGSDDAQVTYVDTWPTVLDAYSYGGSYSFTTIQNDYLLLDFRGVSLKWFATIPDDKIPGTVSIELRSKDSLGVWGSWQVLESSFTLPSDVAGEKIWELTYESGTLAIDTSYQLRITNLDGNFVAVDSFAGYWSATYTEYNEDDSRVNLRHPNIVKQIYDQRLGSGSIYQFDDEHAELSNQAGFTFTGDRFILFSRMGPGYGKIKLYMFGTTITSIPGGTADGGVVIDLEYAHDVPQAVVFDSNLVFTDPFDGLPWGYYSVAIDKVGGTNDIWVDAVGAHETSGLSVKFLNTAYLDVLKNTAEAIQMEWDITERGIKVVPRLGTDTDIIFAEGRGTTIRIEDVQDASLIATQLVGSGADIDGLPLTAVVEDRKTKRLLGRTIQRLYDSRNVGDYFTLIGASRTELLRRRVPQKRVTVQTTDLKGIVHGDSFIVKHPELELRIRAETITVTQSSSSGMNYQIEGTTWPQTI